MANKSNVELWADIHAYRDQVTVLTDRIMALEELAGRAKQLQADLDVARDKIENLEKTLRKERNKSFKKIQAARESGVSEGKEIGRRER